MNIVDIVRTESLSKIREIVNSKGIPIDSRWLDYEALNTAIKSQKIYVAKYLLGQNCRVNKEPQPQVDTPLHNAVESGDKELTYELLKKGAKIFTLDGNGNTPFHIAFIDKHYNLIDFLLGCIQSRTNIPNIKNNEGLTLMHIACARKNLKVVENFIAARITDIGDAVKNDSLAWAGYTALHFAASFKSLEVVKILLKSGANPDAKDANQQTALQIVNEELIDSAMIADTLSKKQDSSNSESCVEDITYFHMACLRNDPVLIEKFINKGAKVDTIIGGNSGIFSECSPLHLATMASQEKNVKVLLQHGAEVDHLNSEQMTPLHHAVYKEDNKIIDLLHEAAFDKLTDLEDSYGLDYFQIAIIRNQIELVEEFLDDEDFEQNVNLPLAEDTPKFAAYYPIHFAARYQHVKMAKLLIKRGADISKVSRDGTPLHIAFASGNLDLIKLFWNNNVDVKILRPSDKATMLHILVRSYVDIRRKEGNKRIADGLLGYVEKLLKLGVDVNAKTQILNDQAIGDIALHLACDKLHLGSPCVKLLLDYGADINLENPCRHLPFPIIPENGCYDEYCGNAADYMMLYHHVQKLKALGFKVHSRNEEFCRRLMKNKGEWDKNAEEFKDENIKLVEQERLDEIKRLKSVKLGENKSLYDFLLLDAKNVVGYANNNVLKKIVGSKTLERDYPSYGYLIKLQYKKAISA